MKNEGNRTSTTLDDLPKLKRLYKKAVKNNEEFFMMNGDRFLVLYAKYLIEYYETRVD